MKLSQELKVVLIVLAVITVGFLAQKYFADRKLSQMKAVYDVQVDRLQADSSKLAGRITIQKKRADSLDRKNDQQAALYGQSTAAIADLRRTVQDQAARLSMGQQIDAIASAINLDGQAERIKQAATPEDAQLVSELYQRVEWGIRQAAKLDTMLRENARLRVINDALTTREAVYKRTLINVQQSLLTEAETERFLGIGRKKAMLKLAQSVGDQVSDLEKVLNGN